MIFSAQPAATLTSIAVTPANATLTVGAAQPYTATGTYSDSGTHDLTSQVTWGVLEHGDGDDRLDRARDRGRGRKHDDLGDPRVGERQHRAHRHAGSAHDHDHQPARGDGWCSLHGHADGHGRHAAVHVVPGERNAPGRADARDQHGFHRTGASPKPPVAVLMDF